MPAHSVRADPGHYHANQDRYDVHVDRQFEQLRRGGPKQIQIDSLDELPRALVKARIAGGLSQKELAERLGLKEQQIQRYEATDYGSASLTRLKEIAQALGVNIAGEMTSSG